MLSTFVVKKSDLVFSNMCELGPNKCPYFHHLPREGRPKSTFFANIVLESNFPTDCYQACMGVC